MEVRTAAAADLEHLTALALLLWPTHGEASLREEMAEWIEGETTEAYLATAAGASIGFALCALRSDYVQGTHTSPVGYLEGIYVSEGHRREGVAQALVKACEDWSRARGCTEMGSDCYLDNTLSIAFHLGSGFREAGRLVTFAKEL